jgi:type IV secretory pathway VirB3-like protein
MMERPPIPEGFVKTVARTSARPTKMVLGVPMEVLAAAAYGTVELWLALDAWPHALAFLCLVLLPARAFTTYDPHWMEIVRQEWAAWIARAAATRGRSLRISRVMAAR